MLKLIKDSDSVELKLTVEPAGQTRPSPRSGWIRSGADPSGLFFDTPDLTLYHQGVVARARRAQKKGNDSVVKLRPVDLDLPPAASDAGFRRRGRRDARRLRLLGLDEGDPGHRCPRDGARGTAAAQAVHEVQRAFYADHAPEGLGLEDLSILGPIFVLKLKFAPKGYDRKMVAEMWLYPDNSRILELSTKCLPSEAFRVGSETRAFLSTRGVDLGGEQETKTKRALEFFAKQLKAKQKAAEQATATAEAADAAKAKAEAEAAEQATARAESKPTESRRRMTIRSFENPASQGQAQRGAK